MTMDNEQPIKNIFVTGPPGSGKSTLIRKIASQLANKGYSVRGIFCPEIRKSGRRWGFKVVTYPEGKEGILASVEIQSSIRVSKYGVDIKTFEAVGVSELERDLHDDNVEVVIIDEIGKMELYSHKFEDITNKLLESDKVVLGVLGRVKHPIVQSIMRRQDTVVFRLFREADNRYRQKIVEKAINIITKYLEQKRTIKRTTKKIVKNSSDSES